MKPRISARGRKVLANQELAKHILLHKDKYRTLLMKDKLLKNN